MAIGFLFLGAGRYTLSTSNEAIGALVCALYPHFPITPVDNRYHMQVPPAPPPRREFATRLAGALLTSLCAIDRPPRTRHCGISTCSPLNPGALWRVMSTRTKPATSPSKCSPPVTMTQLYFSAGSV